jgi:NAD(P)-dependent dehydrogenase (short-subunit alcohol dehydrogenase family)
MTTETAVVMGVGPGLGAALVRRLAASSFTVYAAARRLEALNALDLGADDSSVRRRSCDASLEDQVAGLFAEVNDNAGPPHLVVYNVGGLARGPFLELTARQLEDAWRTICLGAFHTCQAAARLMVPEGRGTILLTGATSALRGRAGFAPVAMARAGLRALSQSLARELGPQGIHVAHVVIDGGIWRPEFEERIRDLPPDVLLDPAAIADTYLALHRQHRSAWSQEVDLRPWVEKF